MRVLRVSLAVLALPVALASVGTSSASAQAQAAGPAADSGTLILTQAGTEIVRERYVRRGGMLEGDMRTVAGQRASYTATLAPDGLITRFEAREYAAPGATAPSQVATVTFRGDSIRVEASANGTPATATIASESGAVPYLNPSPALMGQIVRRARATAAGEQQGRVPVFVLGGGGHTVTATVTFGEGERATLTIGGIAAELVVDEAGNVRSGGVASQGIAIQRTP